MKESRRSGPMGILISVNLLLLVIVVAWLAGDYVRVKREEDARIEEASRDIVDSGAASLSEAKQVWWLLLEAEKGRRLTDDEVGWLLGLLKKDYGQLEYQRRDFFKSYIYRTFQLAPLSTNSKIEEDIAQTVVKQIGELLSDERYFSAVGMPIRVLGARGRAAELEQLAFLESHPDSQIVAEYKAAQAALK